MTNDQITVSRELLRQTIDLLDDMLAPGATFSTASLRAAVEQTAVEPVEELTNKWRKLAHQFDAHRMQALWHLKAMTEDPHVHTAKAVEFLSAPPPQPQQSAPVQEPVGFDAAFDAVNWDEWRHKPVRELVRELHRVTAPVREPAPVQEPVATEPPFGSKRKAAMVVYAPPFSFKHGYIFDSQNLMVADDDKVEGAVASRVRGWGRLRYLPNGAEVQDEIGQMIADALSAYYASPQAQHPRKTVKLTPDEVRSIADECDEGGEDNEYLLALSNAIQDAFIAKNRSER